MASCPVSGDGTTEIAYTVEESAVEHYSPVYDGLDIENELVTYDVTNQFVSGTSGKTLRQA